MPSTQERIIRLYIDAYNHFDIEGMLRDLHPHIVFENVSGGQVTLRLEGIDAFRQQAEGAQQFFSSRHQEIRHLTPVGDKVEVDIRYTAILAVDLPDGPKKGDEILLEGRSIFQFLGNQVVRLTDIS